jgi:two-component system NtrC family sensor kinase
MKKAPVLSNDQQRLKILREYEVLDTSPERQFDDITLLASTICQTPIALVSLIDEDRQWFKSRVGLAATETPRDISYCGHAIHQTEVFIVPDAFADPRFADNPLATGAPHVRFYAGAPLKTPSGLSVGTLCVIDNQPRKLNEDQIKALEALARMVVDFLEIRKANKKLADHIRDSEQKQRVIDQQQMMLIHSAKMSALGEMAGGVAHEINNPLSIIQAKAQFMMKSLDRGQIQPGDPKIRESFDLIQKTTGRMAEIVQGLRHFARDSDGEAARETPLKNMFQEVLSLSTERLKQAEIEVHLPAMDEVFLNCNPVQIEQVMMNLMNNAHDALNSKDRKDTSKKWIRWDLIAEGHDLVLRMSDNGCGIPEHLVQKLMQPFFTTKAPGVGTGLGLSISKGIIEKHGGQLTLISRANPTCFEIRLPQQKKSAAA